MLILNTSAARLIQVVRNKTDGLHVALYRNFSSTVSATDLVKVSRLGKSCSLHSKKYFLVEECGFFANYVISE